MKTYKECLKVEDLVERMREKKKIQYNKISKSQAQRILIMNNYINVVTPFKHYFAKDKEFDAINEYDSFKDDDNEHVYEEEVEFEEYYDLFVQERIQAEMYYSAISKFELMYKSLVCYEFIKKYNIRDSDCAKEAFDILLDKIDRFKIETSGGNTSEEFRKSKMKDAIHKIKKKLDDRPGKNGGKLYAVDIYVLFDRMGIQEIDTVYRGLPPVRQRKTFLKLQDEGLSLGARDHKDFPNKVFNLIAIRNKVMHFNSIEILLKYSDHNKKELRDNKSIKIYEKLLKQLKCIYEHK